MSAAIAHVVVFVQENHTTDNYFRSMAGWGANVATGWPTQPNPPAADQPHTRAAYAKWLHAQQAGAPTPATRTQFDTTADLPFYAYLAATGAFLENHCSGFGTNSTPNHLLIVGGQTPTLRNPPRNQPQPVWDMPSLLGHAQDHQLSWKAYTGSSGYPVSFYRQLAGSPNIVGSDQIVADAANLPALSMVWHDSPFDEHPVADVRDGHDKIWQAVDAVAAAGHWNDTVFLLTWDDLGGWDDHVPTPNVEHTPDGVQLAYGPRAPLLMSGGQVKPGIDSRWTSHVSIGKTVLDLLHLPPLGVPRLDQAVSLADLIDTTTASPPPAFGTTITQPNPPRPTPHRPRHRFHRRRCRSLPRSSRSSCATAPPCPHRTTNPSNSTPVTPLRQCTATPAGAKRAEIQPMVLASSMLKRDRPPRGCDLPDPPPPTSARSSTRRHQPEPSVKTMRSASVSQRRPVWAARRSVVPAACGGGCGRRGDRRTRNPLVSSGRRRVRCGSDRRDWVVVSGGSFPTGLALSLADLRAFPNHRARDPIATPACNPDVDRPAAVSPARQGRPQACGPNVENHPSRTCSISTSAGAGRRASAAANPEAVLQTRPPGPASSSPHLRPDRAPPIPCPRHHQPMTHSPPPEPRPPLFDAHLHVIDPAFPLIRNDGYLPPAFTTSDYRNRTRELNVVGGAVVSGSFQTFDQTYLVAALADLGPSFVGVAQLPATTPDAQVLALAAAGVRAVRFNVRRGGSETLEQLDRLARRVHELAGWHTELYIDAADLPDLGGTLAALPQVSIDHLGLSREGLPYLLRLAERGVHVKATGFSRGDLDVPDALRRLADANPGALLVGTDLPSTRAPQAFTDTDLDLVVQALQDDRLIEAAFTGNAVALYRPSSRLDLP